MVANKKYQFYAVLLITGHLSIATVFPALTFVAFLKTRTSSIINMKKLMLFGWLLVATTVLSAINWF